MSKLTPSEQQGPSPKKPDQPAKVRRRPADDLVAANRVEQILLPLTIEQADWVLKRAMDMHKHRCELVNKPPFHPNGAE